MKMKSFKVKSKEVKKRGIPVPPSKSMKSKKTYTRKNNKEDMDESTSIRSLLSKFVTNIFEKKYSDANTILSSVITEKLKNKIKKATNDKKCDCKCDDCKCDDCKKNKKSYQKVTKQG